jgi:hypothetical protein
MKLPVDYSQLSIPDKRAVREEYIKRQDGNCWHCKCSLTGEPPKTIKSLPVNKALFPGGFFEWPVHLLHSHDTGLTIGAVHNYCNAVLWQYHGE